MSAVQLVERWEAAPIERVRVAVGRDSNIDLEALARFARGWEKALGVTIDVSKVDGTPEVDLGVPLVVDADIASSLAASDNRKAMAVSFDGAAGCLDPKPGELARIGGRGIGGYRWAVRHLVACGAWPAETYSYGPDPEQFADLRLPNADGPHPVVILIHGGGWKHRWQRDLMAPIAVDLAEQGYASWNVEFRRVGGGGGWPATFDDLRAGIDALREVNGDGRLDLDRVCFLGHSSGGHLALWAAGERQLHVRPTFVVALAGVTDLHEAARRQLVGGENIVLSLLGGTPDEMPERYASASPTSRLPLGISQLLVQGLSDYISDLVDLNRCYARAAAEAGDDIELIELPGVEHLEPIEAATTAWQLTRDKIKGALGRGAT